MAVAASQHSARLPSSLLQSFDKAGSIGSLVSITLYENHIRNRCTRRWRFTHHIVSHYIVGHQIVWAKFGDCGGQRAQKLAVAIQFHARFEIEQQRQPDAI